jgi:hypothetical protein
LSWIPSPEPGRNGRDHGGNPLSAKWWLLHVAALQEIVVRSGATILPR